MNNIKQDFPIFQTHPDLVYLDSTATSQKPSHVIDGVAEYLSSSYANIHRGSYDISEISEKLYEDSKKIVAKHTGAENWREIIYTQNSTYALNLLSQSIWRTGLLKKGDTVLVSITEHHANLVPWLILKEDYGINVEYVAVDENYDLNYDDLKSKLNDSVKIVSLAHVSNTTGQIFDIEKVNQTLDERYGKKCHPELDAGSSNNDSVSSTQGQLHRPLIIIDGSQSVPHFGVDVAKLGCDAMFFTGHKIFADSGIGVLWAKEELLQTLKPIFSGGGAIGEVHQGSFTHSSVLPDKFEPGTPNLSGAVSLLRAFEYLESIGGYKKMEAIESELVKYTLEKFEELQASPQPSPSQGEGETAALLSSEGQVREGTQGLSRSGSEAEEIQRGGNYVKLVGSNSPSHRVGVFTFYIEGIHSFDISDYLAEENICVRAGQHCAEPFMRHIGQQHTCRMSLQIYNTKEDIDRFFEVLESAILELT